MKTGKIKSLVMTMAVMALTIMTSCGGGVKPEEVAAKIDAQEELSQKDYAAVLDYCGDYAKKAQQYFEIINSQPNDSTAQYIRAADDMAALVQEYPYLDMFRNVVYNLKDSDLDKENQKKVEEYTKYQAFPLPEGAGPDLSTPGVVGDIEDMPSQAGTDSTGVISQGDGVVVDETVGK